MNTNVNVLEQRDDYFSSYDDYLDLLTIRSDASTVKISNTTTVSTLNNTIEALIKSLNIIYRGSINFSKRLTKKKKKMRIPKLPPNVVVIIVAIVLQAFEYYSTAQAILTLFVGVYALDQVQHPVISSAQPALNMDDGGSDDSSTSSAQNNTQVNTEGATIRRTDNTNCSTTGAQPIGNLTGFVIAEDNGSAMSSLGNSVEQNDNTKHWWKNNCVTS